MGTNKLCWAEAGVGGGGSSIKYFFSSVSACALGEMMYQCPNHCQETYFVFMCFFLYVRVCT